MSRYLMIGASVGNCVHVAGVAHFLNLAEGLGYETIFTGPAVKVETLIELIQKHDADVVALGYRLTPENAVPIVEELKEKSRTLEAQPTWVFGRCRPCCSGCFSARFLRQGP